MTPGVLIAGVGNIFLGDDGFGVEVARRLAAEKLPRGIRVADFGIRGLHLAYQLLESYDAVILVDALSRGEVPGTIFLLEPELGDGGNVPSLDAHGLDPASVLRTVKALGGALNRVFVVGCEPAELVERIGLSEPVKQAIVPAIELIRELLNRELEQAALRMGNRREPEMRMEEDRCLEK